MADIAMCKGRNCKLKMKCYRYTAPQSEHGQAWFMNTPTNKGDDCEFFWDNEDEHKDIRHEDDK